MRIETINFRHTVDEVGLEFYVTTNLYHTLCHKPVGIKVLKTTKWHKAAKYYPLNFTLNS